MSPEECKKYLRYLELDAYAKMVSALRAQGPLTDGKQKLLKQLATTLHITHERHQAEIRRAINDEKLSVIADQIFGPESETEWTSEGRRLVPLFPRLKSRNAYTTFSNSIGLSTAIANEKPPGPKKKEEKMRSRQNSCCTIDDKLLSIKTENDINCFPRKRKRSYCEVNNMNNGLQSICSSSYTSNIRSLAKNKNLVMAATKKLNNFE